MKDDLKKYFDCLYGGLTEGFIGITSFGKKSMNITWVEVNDRARMTDVALRKGVRTNTSVGINPRRAALPDGARGTAADISALVSLYLDFDIKGPAHKQEGLPASEEELKAFLQQFPVPTITVNSGNGLHCYWVLEKPFIINDDSDRRKAESIMKGFEQTVLNAALGKGWKFDPVADLARMLRCPETKNFKTEDRPVCRIEQFTDKKYSLSDFEGYALPVRNTDDTDFALMGRGSAEVLINKCEFLKHCEEDAANLSEPEWHAAITNVALTKDGHEAVHRISEPYPEYSYDETERKYRTAAENDMPATCQFIHEKLGFTCSHSCGVKCPVELVHEGPSQWEAPIPFEAKDLPEFPVDALPEPIADFVTALAESTQTPVDLAAVSALPVMAAALQGKYKVKGKDDWYEPLNLYALAIAAPSERKSAVESAMVRPLDDYEADWNRSHAGDIQASLSEQKVLERKLKAAEDALVKGKITFDEMQNAASEYADYKPMSPMRLSTDNVTPEKLTSILFENDGKASILSSEGGLFDILSGQYSKSVNIDTLLKAYSGDVIKTDRVGRQSETIPHPALTILLMAQPKVLEGMMENSVFTGRGLTARFLYTMPKSKVGARDFYSKPVSDFIRAEYESRIHNLLVDDKKDAVIYLSPEASKVLGDFATALEPRLKEDLLDIAEWAGKLVGNTLRIAGLLCRGSVEKIPSEELLFDDPKPLVIDEKTMRNAVRIAEYFIGHAKAAFSLMGAGKSTKDCEKVLSVIKRNDLEQFTAREMLRKCRSFHTMAELQPVLDQLCDYGYIAPEGKGKKYLVNPEVSKGGGAVA